MTIDSSSRPLRRGRRDFDDVRLALLAAAGTLLLATLGAGDLAEPTERRMLDDLSLAIPVPPRAELLCRSIDPVGGRSFAVLDLDPSDPPSWSDVVVAIRRASLPGLLVGRATVSTPLPGPEADSWEWRAYAAGTAVRVRAYRDHRAAWISESATDLHAPGEEE